MQITLHELDEINYLDRSQFVVMVIRAKEDSGT